MINARETLLAVAEALPRRDWLAQEVQDAEEAQTRGYYLPDEDERLRKIYAQYLSMREVLLGVIRDLEPSLRQELRGEDEEVDLEVFATAFAAASILFRAGTYLIDVAADRRVVWKKLDEAESRYGIPRKSFSQVYRSATSPMRLWRYHEAWRYYSIHREEIHAMAQDPDWKEVVDVLLEEEPFMEQQRKDYVKRRLSYRLHAFKRRHYSGYRKVMFHLLRVTGSLVAELNQPGKNLKRPDKRVTDQVREGLLKHAQPGDVMVTRHDDALSNLFLPGFWPHAALYLGSREQRATMGLPEFSQFDEGGNAFVEAKKDGVKFRAAKETLSVDTVLVLRPKMELRHVAEAIEGAVSHVGKRYDFAFDFRQADRLACTAVVYRSYHGQAGYEFCLNKHAGKLALSAEDLIDQLIGVFGFEVIAISGLKDDEILLGDEAKRVLQQSYKAGW